MRSRPWPIVILALFQIFAPLSSLVLNAYLDSIPFGVYLKLFFEKSSTLTIVEHFALLPIAGIATFMVKKWSFPVILVIHAFILVRNTIIWFESYSDKWGIGVFFLISAINLGLITYYLLPAVRKIYFDERLRWWDSLPRYKVSIPAQLDIDGQIILGYIRDLSEGGAFVQIEAPAEINDEVTLLFDIFNREVALAAKIVHRRGGDTPGFGLQFSKDRQQRVEARNMVIALKLLGCELTAYREPLLPSFFNWIISLKKGEGFVPSISTHRDLGND